MVDERRGGAVIVVEKGRAGGWGVPVIMVEMAAEWWVV